MNAVDFEGCRIDNSSDETADEVVEHPDYAI